MLVLHRQHLIHVPALEGDWRLVIHRAVSVTCTGCLQSECNYLCHHKTPQVQKLHTIIKDYGYIGSIRELCALHNKMMSHKTTHYYILAERLHILQVTRPFCGWVGYMRLELHVSMFFDKHRCPD